MVSKPTGNSLKEGAGFLLLKASCLLMVWEHCICQTFLFGGRKRLSASFCICGHSETLCAKWGKKNPTHFFLFFMLGGFWTGVRQNKVSPLEEHRRPLQLSVTMT